MKILLVHNDYGKYSGEEAVVDSMAKIYNSLGYDVAEYRKSTAMIQDSLKGKIKAFVYGIFPQLGVKKFSKVLEAFTPDVVHIHNLYPFIGPAILKICKKKGVRVVMTIHNFRLICPTGLFMRNYVPCECCLKKGNEFSCVKYNCEHNMLKSLGYALRNFIARKKGYYLNYVDQFCCITEFQKKKLVAAGFDANKIIVIPNGLDDVYIENSNERGYYVGYCGRISEEKGIDLIIEVARRNPLIQFKFAGGVREGYDIGDIPANCEFLGHLSGKPFQAFFKNARFFVMASKWYEGFPMSILDAVKHGKCVVAPNHGGFTEIIENRGTPIGRLFVPGDVDSLEQNVVSLWNDVDRINQYAAEGRKAIAEKYSFDAIRERWRKIINK